MAPPKASKKPDRPNEKLTRKPSKASSKGRTRDLNEKQQQPEPSNKSNHHILHPHLPHIPHPHLHRHDEKSTSIQDSSPANQKSTKTKPPSTHANFAQTQPKTSTSSSHSFDATMPNRPGPLRRQTSVKTRYMTMLLDLDTIPRLHNILASFSTLR